MRAIFLSYRRDDAEGEAGRLFDALKSEFGADKVFMDVSGIEPGRDFRRVIEQNVASCGVLLAMIGRGWIDAKDHAGRRRLDDPQDFVRLETAAALKRDIPVIPVLVRGGSLPLHDQLPEDLKDLAYRNAVELTHARWDSDVQLLIKALRPYVDKGPEEAGKEKTRPTPERPGGKAATLVSGEVGRTSTAAPTQPPKWLWRRRTVMAGVGASVIAIGGLSFYEYRRIAYEEETKRKLASNAEESKRILADIDASHNKAQAIIDSMDLPPKLERATGDMGVMSGLIARNHQELEELKRYGDRNYYEFTLSKSDGVQQVGPVQLRLTAARPGTSRYSMIILADGKSNDRRDKSAGNPVQIYVKGTARSAPYEIVVFDVGVDKVSGYLAVPK